MVWRGVRISPLACAGGYDLANAGDGFVAAWLVHDRIDRLKILFQQVAQGEFLLLAATGRSIGPAFSANLSRRPSEFPQRQTARAKLEPKRGRAW
jgi:hypothetical protein